MEIGHWEKGVVKEVLRKKYIKKPRTKMLDGEWKGKGTTLWQLCKATINIIKENCYWIPGNGKKINIWNRSILGHPPRSTIPGLGSFSEWLSAQDILSLFDLSRWDEDGQWIGWKDISPPDQLRNLVDLFLSSLHGLSPSSLSAKDRLGWGKSGQYTVKEGYKIISMEQMMVDKIWKKGLASR